MTSLDCRHAPPPFSSVLDMVGGSRVVELSRLDTGPCRLFAKLEMDNPGGSIKDRIAKRMIEQAEEDGLLLPGGTLVEATAGNTGLGLALIASLKGYLLKVVVPDKMSQEKIDHLRALGAEVVLSRSDVPTGHEDHYQAVAERIAEQEGAFYVNQFGNAANVAAHYEGTGPEIWSQLDGQVDAAVFAVGTGGTLTGTSRFLLEQNPELEVVLADPEGSILAPLVETGEMITAGSWLTEGIGEDMVPAILELETVRKTYTVSDREAFLTARELLRVEGLFAGSSSGVILAAALAYCREQRSPKRVVALMPDTGNKYLSKMFSDHWMVDHGFLERERHGDLRDLVTRPHSAGDDHVVAPGDTLATARGRMKAHGVSQLPVIADGLVVGLVTEETLMGALVEDRGALREAVGEHMEKAPVRLPASASLEELRSALATHGAVLVQDGEQYHGLVTTIDVVDHLAEEKP